MPPNSVASAAVSVAADGDVDEPFGQLEELEKERRKSEADSHVEKYVKEQLTRIQTGGSLEGSVFEDEFEAQLD